MKKILIGYVNSNIGNGINKYIISVIEFLRNNDCEVDVLTRDNNPKIKEIWKKNGCKNVYIISRNRRPFKQFEEMKKILVKKYDIAYYNVSEPTDCIGMIISKYYGVKNVIAHSHSSNIEEQNIVKRVLKIILNKLAKKIVYKSSNKYFACSEEAAKWMFPKKIIKNKNYTKIYNTVSYEKFKFDVNIRNMIRKELSIEDNFVIGHVGRFADVKNHVFLLEIFKELLNINLNARLICVGDGYKKNEIIEYAKKLDIFDKIIFTGKLKNVDQILQAFDVFVLPSLYEGLPIVGIEAQMSGLPCIFSKNISPEVMISEKVYLIDIKSPKEWAIKINKLKERDNQLTKNAELYKSEVNCEQYREIL